MESQVPEIVEAGDALNNAGEQVSQYFEKIDEKSNEKLEKSNTTPYFHTGDSKSTDQAGDNVIAGAATPTTPMLALGSSALDPTNNLELVPVGDVSSSMDTYWAGGALNRELVLAKLNKEKILSLIKAWEENEKRKSSNSFNKKIAKIGAWEVAKIARAEANLRTTEERLETEKAACIERTRNKIALVQKMAEEQRALAEARQGGEISKAEEIAAKCRASGTQPWRFPFCC